MQLLAVNDDYAWECLAIRAVPPDGAQISSIPHPFGEWDGVYRPGSLCVGWVSKRPGRRS